VARGLAGTSTLSGVDLVTPAVFLVFGSSDSDSDSDSLEVSALVLVESSFLTVEGLACSFTGCPFDFVVVAGEVVVVTGLTCVVEPVVGGCVLVPVVVVLGTGCLGFADFLSSSDF